MEQLQLDAQLRTEVGRREVNAVRRDNFIPAVVYGKGKKSQNIKVNRREFLGLLKGHHGGENVVLNLNILGQDSKKSKDTTVIIKDIQHNPVSDEIIHIDFNQISLTEAIVVKVPIVAKGEPVGVKQEGGSLEHVLWELEIECLPTKIPAKIEFDVSNLKIGDAIHVKDLSIPPDIKVLSDPELTVLSVAAPIKEEVVPEEVAVEEAAQEPEVIKEKKEVPEEGAEAEGEEKKEKKEKKEEKKEEKKKEEQK